MKAFGISGGCSSIGSNEPWARLNCPDNPLTEKPSLLSPKIWFQLLSDSTKSSLEVDLLDDSILDVGTNMSLFTSGEKEIPRIKIIPIRTCLGFSMDWGNLLGFSKQPFDVAKLLIKYCCILQ
jgi:hypothetical protein